jgi:type VI protein secretion system component Hcp
VGLFITIPGLTGPVLTAGRVGTFSAQAVAWGIQLQPPPLLTGGKGQRRLLLLKVTKTADAASVPAYESLAKNTPISATPLTLINDRLVADKRVAIATFELTKPIVARQSFSGSTGGSDNVVETVDFVYEQVTVQNNSSGDKFIDTFPG